MTRWGSEYLEKRLKEWIFKKFVNHKKAVLPSTVQYWLNDCMTELHFYEAMEKVEIPDIDVECVKNEVEKKLLKQEKKILKIYFIKLEPGIDAFIKEMDEIMEFIQD